MGAELAPTIVSGVTAIIVTYMGVIQRKALAKSNECEGLKREGSLLQLEMIQSLLKLSQVTAKAVRNETLNGDVKEAEDSIHAAEMKFNDYMRRATQVVNE